MKSIRKSDIIKCIWSKNSKYYSLKDVEYIVNTFIDIIGNELRAGSKVKIEGLGTFSTFFKKIHVKKTLDTGVEKDIHNVKCISFKPSKKLKY